MADYVSMVEDFAALCAKLDDPFGDRARLLAEVGLDEPSYAALLGEWRQRLAQEEAPAKNLGRRFVDAYRNAVEARRSPPRDEIYRSQKDSRFLNENAQTWRSEAARVALSMAPEAEPSLPRLNAAESLRPAFVVSPAGTLPPAAPEYDPEINGPSTLDALQSTGPLPPLDLSKPVLPFASAPAPRTELPRSSSLTGLPFKSAEPAERRDPHCADQAPIPPSAIPAQGAIVPPGKRLVLFDSETGKPLPLPVWVDVVDHSKQKG
jgi:hypothetical protein